MKLDSRIFIAGHRGLVGSAIVRNLEKRGYKNLILRSRDELDLLDQSRVRAFFEKEKPEFVFLAAARVGGIHANSHYPADFLYENLAIMTHILKSAADNDVSKLLYLGSSCIYPKLAPQPIKEESLLSGPLEPTNEAYAIAKIAGLKLCSFYRRQYGKNFISAMPTNLYGPHDNFHPENSHVIPGLLRRFHEAKVQGQPKVTIWGTGSPKREFLFVDDLAEALFLLMEKYEEDAPINVGTGEDQTILELAGLVKETVGFEGEIATDPNRPDGTPRKCLDVSRLRALGFNPKYSLKEGLKQTYRWALEQKSF